MKTHRQRLSDVSNRLWAVSSVLFIIGLICGNGPLVTVGIVGVYCFENLTRWCDRDLY